MNAVVTVYKQELIDLIQKEVQKNFPGTTVDRDFHTQLPEQVEVKITLPQQRREEAK